jgi:solute carrier family 35
MMTSDSGYHLGWAVMYYSICSSTLLIVNKVALHYFPAPVLQQSSLQLWFAVGVLHTLRCFEVLKVTQLDASDAFKYLPVVVSFLGTLFANAKVLQFSNVETFITCRSSTHLVLSLCDWLFLGRTLPSLRSICCLLGLLTSTVGCAFFDSSYSNQAYSWIAAWFVCFVTHEVVVKHLCDTVNVDNWTRVLYTNLTAGAMLVFAIPLVKHEHEIATTFQWDASAAITIIASCAIGVCVSHSAYVLPSVCSATLNAVIDSKTCIATKA